MSLSDTKVLLLNVNRTGWHSGNMVYDMEALFKGCDTTPYGPGWPDYNHNDLPSIIKQVYGDGKPDIIYSYFTPNERVGDVYIKHYKIPENLWVFPTKFDQVKGSIKIFALSDFWARRPGRYARDLGQQEADFTHCFCCFAPPYSNPKDFYSFFNQSIQDKIKFIGYPRCMDHNCYKDYGLDQEYDVITVGAMGNFYPLRVHMHRYLAKNHQSLGIKYINYPHCGIHWGHSGFVRETYAQAINASKMLVSCGGRYHLAMNKIFESMGCKTLYIGERPYGESELHMKDGFNYVAVNAENFVDKIKHFLDNDEERFQITENASETLMRYHTIDARAKDFVKLINAL